VAVKIRLKRMGKIRAPYYRIVVADSRTKRDGRVIEEIGKYHPTEEPSFIEVQSERALYWLGVGAQPSPQVEAILKLTGDWGKFKGDKNATSTVKTKEAKVEFLVDEKKKPVLKPKSEKPVAKVEVAAPVETPAAAEPVAVAEPVEAPAPDNAVAEADAAADQVRAEEADESTTTTHETPEQVDNSDAPAAAAAEPEATDAEAVAEEAAEPVAVAEPVEAPTDDAPAEAAASSAEAAGA
jgi:small subunit ribosomal protein S16